MEDGTDEASAKAGRHAWNAPGTGEAGDPEGSRAVSSRAQRRINPKDSGRFRPLPPKPPLEFPPAF
jgi:hypothetical protein